MSALLLSGVMRTLGSNILARSSLSSRACFDIFTGPWALHLEQNVSENKVPLDPLTPENMVYHLLSLLVEPLEAVYAGSPTAQAVYAGLSH